MESTDYTDKKISALNEAVEHLDAGLIDASSGKLYQTIVETVEKPLIEKVLKRTYGNQIKAAKILGINRNTLHAKIQKLSINVEEWKE